MRVDIQQLQFIDSHIRAMVRDIEAKFRVEFEVTSMYRIDDSGVHGTLPLRGLDLGCKDEVIGNRVAEFVNLRWLYDPARPEKVCAVWHKTKNGAPHIHLQSHPSAGWRYQK